MCGVHVCVHVGTFVEIDMWPPDAYVKVDSHLSLIISLYQVCSTYLDVYLLREYTPDGGDWFRSFSSVSHGQIT